MAGKRKLILEVIADADKLDRGLKKSDRLLGRFQKDVERKAGRGGAFGTMLLGRGGLAVAGGAIAGGFLKQAADQAKEAEASAARLAGAYRSAGVDVGKAGSEVDSFINKLSRVSAFDDEALADGFANLLRTTGNVKDATDDLALATDIARARNISLESAVKVVEQAELGRLRGLKSTGVEIDNNTTKQEALRRATEKFAGDAARYGDTAAGAQERLRVSYENLQEEIGTRLLPVLADMSGELAGALEYATDLLDKLDRISNIKIPGLGRLGGAANIAKTVATHTGPVGFFNAIRDPGGQIKVSDRQREIILQLDGKTLGKVTTTSQTAAGKKVDVQKRGPHAGLRT